MGTGMALPARRGSTMGMNEEVVAVWKDRFTLYPGMPVIWEAF